MLMHCAKRNIIYRINHLLWKYVKLNRISVASVCGTSWVRTPVGSERKVSGMSLSTFNFALRL